MGLLSETESTYYDITKTFIDDVEAIFIDDIIFVSNDFKIDLEMLSHYGLEKGLDYLPLILMFNGLDSIVDIPNIIAFKFPNIESLLKHVIILENEDFNVGVTEPTLNNKKGFVVDKTKPPSTKLNLSMKSVSYDKEKGNITY